MMVVGRAAEHGPLGSQFAGALNFRSSISKLMVGANIQMCSGGWLDGAGVGRFGSILAKWSWERHRSVTRLLPGGSVELVTCRMTFV